MSSLIDHAHLADQTFGDDALARDVLDLFRAQCLRLLPGIADATGDGGDRADLAHTLKGSALGIGARRIAELSAAIEDGLRRNGEASPAILASLAEAAAATLAEIDAVA